MLKENKTIVHSEGSVQKFFPHLLAEVPAPPSLPTVQQEEKSRPLHNWIRTCEIRWAFFYSVLHEHVLMSVNSMEE